MGLQQLVKYWGWGQGQYLDRHGAGAHDHDHGSEAASVPWTPSDSPRSARGDVPIAPSPFASFPGMSPSKHRDKSRGRCSFQSPGRAGHTSVAMAVLPGARMGQLGCFWEWETLHMP